MRQNSQSNNRNPKEEESQFKKRKVLNEVLEYESDTRG